MNHGSGFEQIRDSKKCSNRQCRCWSAAVNLSGKEICSPEQEDR